jgi:hypothetical protein
MLRTTNHVTTYYAYRGKTRDSSLLTTVSADRVVTRANYPIATAGTE